MWMLDKNVSNDATVVRRHTHRHKNHYTFLIRFSCFSKKVQIKVQVISSVDYLTVSWTIAFYFMDTLRNNGKHKILFINTLQYLINVSKSRK